MSLPSELQQLICEDINQRDLAVCARVNKEWKRVVTPWIWHKLDVKNEQRGMFMRAEAQQGLRQNAAYVRDLHINLTNMAVYRSIFTSENVTPYSLQITLCALLQKLTIYGYPLKSECFTLGKNLGGLVQQNPGLTDLTVLCSEPTIIMGALVYARNMRRLCVYGLRPEDITVLLSLLPASVEDIQLGVEKDARNNGALSEVEDNPAFPTFPALRRIALEGIEQGVGNDVLLQLLQSCSQLTTFKISSNQPFLDDSCRAALADLGIFMDSIFVNDLPMATESKDDEIAWTLSFGSGHLKHIDLLDCSQAGPLTVAAILDSYQHLEYINLTGCGNTSSPRSIESRDLQAILCKAPKLKFFIVFEPAITTTAYLEATTIEPFLDAEDILESEWATQSLEVFRCRIMVPRPELHDKETSSELEQSRDIQRKVYARLATQPKLQVISLDLPIYRDTAQFQCRWGLEMTLESGLDQLADLKDMVALSVKGIEHRMGVKEFEWLHASWPELQSVRGIFFEGHNHDFWANYVWMTRLAPRWLRWSEVEVGLMGHVR